MNKAELQDFEQEIADIYKTGAIKGPIHLRSGNEDKLVDIFKQIKPYDYKFATWANHLEALLSGIPREEVKARILEGRSMAMNFPEYRFYTSAIVGGICPIGVGVAWSIKQRADREEKVWMFIGDMTLHCGITHECIKYCLYNNLPVKWVVGNNYKSVDTPTKDAWKPEKKYGNDGQLTLELVRYYNKLARKFGYSKYNRETMRYEEYIIYYSYKNKYPHSGIGQFVSF